jgi:hypothetical protein
MLEDEHRSSMGRSYSSLTNASKYYVAKSFEEQKKKKEKRKNMMRRKEK